MLTNKEYIKNDGAICPNCKVKANQMNLGPAEAIQNETCEKIECLECGATWWEVYILGRYEELEVDGVEHNPPDPKPVVVIEVEGGVASVLECPEWVEVTIVDKDTQPNWEDVSRHHLAEMTSIGLTNLRAEVNRERDNIGESITLRLLEMIRKERVRRHRDA